MKFRNENKSNLTKLLEKATEIERWYEFKWLTDGESKKENDQITEMIREEEWEFLVIYSQFTLKEVDKLSEIDRGGRILSLIRRIEKTIVPWLKKRERMILKHKRK